MSFLKTIRAQLGLSVTPANNFSFDASADNGTMLLERGNGQDIMTIDAAGKVAFPQLANGANYEASPNGMLIQWGTSSTSSGGPTTVTFPISFVGSAPSVQVTYAPTGTIVGFYFGIAQEVGLTSFGIGTINHDGTRVSVTGAAWIAVGRWK